MPDSKITALTSISTSTDPANDPLVIVDVSDTSMAATGTTKKVTLNQLLGASGTATLASATITGDLTVDTSTLKVDSANNRVGIGTATPSASLDVNGASNLNGNVTIANTGSPFGTLFVTGSALELQANSNATNGLSLKTTSATPIIFSVNGSEAMRLNSNGLGVGASPSYKLHVNGTDTTNVLFNGATKGVRFVASASKYSIAGVDNTGAATFQPLAIGGASLEFQIGSTTQMTLDSAGNVGIGVTPSAWSSGLRAINFSTNGVLYANGGNSVFFGNNYYNDGAGTNRYLTNNVAAAYGQVSGAHQWFTAPSGTAGNAITFTQAMTLDASGNLGIGVTPSATLDVYAASGDCTAQFKSNAAGSNVISTLDYVSSYGITRIKKSGTTVWETGVIGSTSATPSYSIFNASSIGVYLTSGGTSWTGISDERLKDIIEPISNAVQKVGSLRSVIGKFKNDETNTRRSFLIAQDVQAVLPEAVDASNPDRLGVAYTDVIPLLVAAIKELTAEVNALKNA